MWNSDTPLVDSRHIWQRVIASAIVSHSPMATALTITGRPESVTKIVAAKREERRPRRMVWRERRAVARAGIRNLTGAGVVAWARRLTDQLLQTPHP